MFDSFHYVLFPLVLIEYCLVILFFYDEICVFSQNGGREAITRIGMNACSLSSVGINSHLFHCTFMRVCISVCFLYIGKNSCFLSFCKYYFLLCFFMLFCFLLMMHSIVILVCLRCMRIQVSYCFKIINDMAKSLEKLACF